MKQCWKKGDHGSLPDQKTNKQKETWMKSQNKEIINKCSLDIPFVKDYIYVCILCK